MARYVDSGYGTPYGRAATPPTYDVSYGSYSVNGGVGDTRRVPQGPVGNNYQRDEFDEYAKKSYLSPAAQKPYPSPANLGYGSSGQLSRPGEYVDNIGNKDWQKSGRDNYRGEKDDFTHRREIAAIVPTVIEGYVTSRPGHGTGLLSKPTNDIGAAVEILKDTVTHSSASGGYPQTHQAGSRYTESASAVYYYPEIMPHTMDPTKRYGNINLGSLRPAAAEVGRNYY